MNSCKQCSNLICTTFSDHVKRDLEAHAAAVRLDHRAVHRGAWHLKWKPLGRLMRSATMSSPMNSAPKMCAGRWLRRHHRMPRSANRMRIGMLTHTWEQRAWGGQSAAAASTFQGTAKTRATA